MRLQDEAASGQYHTQFQSQMRSRSTCDQPSPMDRVSDERFQSQMRSRSTCDDISFIVHNEVYHTFQFQMRSRSTCDEGNKRGTITQYLVSISDEKALQLGTSGTMRRQYDSI